MEKESQNMTIQTCPKCHICWPAQHDFCSKCGEPLHEELFRPREKIKRSSSLKFWEPAHHRQYIKNARFAMMVIAIITMYSAISLWYTLDIEIAKLRNDSNFEINESVIEHAHLVYGVIFCAGFLYVILFLWSKKDPFAASLTALVIFVSGSLVAAAKDPSSLKSNWFFIIPVSFILFYGVKSGLGYTRKIQVSKPLKKPTNTVVE